MSPVHRKILSSFAVIAGLALVLCSVAPAAVIESGNQSVPFGFATLLISFLIGLALVWSALNQDEEK